MPEAAPQATATPAAPETPPAATATAPQVTPPAPHPVTVHPKTKANPQSAVVGLLLQYWYVLALVVILLIALLAVRALRARREDAFDRSLGRLSTPEFEPEPCPRQRTDTMPVRSLAADARGAFLQRGGIRHASAAVFDEPLPATEATGQRVAIDEGMTGEVPVALDQGDPLAEADFHMAYGLYDQAAELVQNAIAREPQRRDLKLKLLEVYFVWGNKERFLQSAHELANSRAQAPAGEWEKIVIMGRQIAPEDALFADGRAVSGAASAGVDLNLEGGQNRVDFDCWVSPRWQRARRKAWIWTSAPRWGQPDPDRTHNHLGANDATGEAQNLGNSVDFDLDGPPLATEGHRLHTEDAGWRPGHRHHARDAGRAGRRARPGRYRARSGGECRARQRRADGGAAAACDTMRTRPSVRSSMLQPATV